MKPMLTRPVAAIAQTFWPRFGSVFEKTVQASSGLPWYGPALQAMFPDGVRKPVWVGTGAGTARASTASGTTTPGSYDGGVRFAAVDSAVHRLGRRSGAA